jgi:hypothetical protein
VADTYADALDTARGLLGQARLSDPGEHFPYKHADISALIAENPPMGPDGPDDERVRAEDFTSQEIADATKVYIDAQAEYLTDRGDATREAYEQAKRNLVEARQAHRANRTGMVVNAVRAPRVGE